MDIWVPVGGGAFSVISMGGGAGIDAVAAREMVLLRLFPEMHTIAPTQENTPKAILPTLSS